MTGWLLSCCIAQDLRRHVAERLAAHADNKAMSKAGADWIRGYDDWNRPQVRREHLCSVHAPS